MTDKIRLAVLVSGGGTNLQAMLDRIRDGSLAAEVAVVVSDREDAHGLTRARQAGIPAHVVTYGAPGTSPPTPASTPAQPPVPPGSQKSPIEPAGKEPAGAVEGGGFPIPKADIEALDRKQRILFDPDPELRIRKLARLVRAEQQLVSLLDGYAPDYVCLAGYMRLVTPYFLGRYNRDGRYRVLNIHPALLPAFPGQHGYEDTFSYGCKWGGVTVHFVDEGEDSGPVIAQAVYPIWPDDDIDAVKRRGLRMEYEIYSQCVNWLAQGLLEVKQTTPDGRPRVAVTDPAYASVLRKWIDLALSSR